MFYNTAENESISEIGHFLCHTRGHQLGDLTPDVNKVFQGICSAADQVRLVFKHNSFMDQLFTLIVCFYVISIHLKAACGNRKQHCERKPLQTNAVNCITNS